MAHIEAVCINSKKGVVKKEKDQINLKENWGILGDTHADDWHRQVSLLVGENIDNGKKILPILKNGAFAENIVTRGMKMNVLKIGDTLRVG